MKLKIEMFMTLLKKGTSKILNLSLIFAAVLFSMTACDDDDDENIVPQEVAYVSLYQASPDAPDLNIMVDNRRINTYPFDYTDHTGYLRFHTGERNLKFGPYGASNVVADTTVTFEDGEAYSVFVAGNYADLDILTFEDTTDPPAEGNAMVRLLNLSPDAPPVNLFVDGETNALFTDQSFKEAPEFIEVDAGQYDFQVKGSDNGSISLNLPDRELQEGWYYTIVVRGYVTPPAGNSNVLSAEVIVN